MTFINFIEIAISAALLGVIWLVQLVHYPSFRYYNERDFQESMKFHQERISFIVLPLMLAEIGLATFLAYDTASTIKIVILVIVSLIWLSTFCLQVPQHQRLLVEGKNRIIIQKLVRSNWLRTVLWSIKMILVWV